MLSLVLCILPQETMLQIETGRQRDPKESWMEESHRSFYTYRGFYAEKSLHKGAFYTQKVLHREVFTLRSFCAQTSRSLYTQKLLHKEVFTQKAFYTQTRLHTEAFTQRSLHTKELLHTKAFTHSKLLHTQGLLHREVLTQRSFLHTEGFTQRSLYSKELLHTNVFLLPSCRNRSCLFQSCDLEKESMVNQHTAGSTHQRNGHTLAGYGQNVRKP